MTVTYLSVMGIFFSTAFFKNFQIYVMTSYYSYNLKLATKMYFNMLINELLRKQWASQKAKTAETLWYHVADYRDLLEVQGPSLQFMVPGKAL